MSNQMSQKKSRFQVLALMEQKQSSLIIWTKAMIGTFLGRKKFCGSCLLTRASNASEQRGVSLT
jgi:hypothetical protein